MISGKPCLGCGQLIETDQKLCERCFRLKNYGDISHVDFDNEEYLIKLKQTIKQKDLVVLVLDILNLPEDIKKYTEMFLGKMLILFTKIDLLPESVKLEKVMNLYEEDTMAISSVKKHGLDKLYTYINKHEGKVYLIGNANAGKSTLINQLLASYKHEKSLITTSHLAGTTLDFIKIRLNDEITLIDTPGIFDNDDITLYLDKKSLKLIIPKTEIKPKTYQLEELKALNIENILRFEYNAGDNNSITFYMSNNLNLEHININTNLRNTDLTKHEIILTRAGDIVIKGLGFIKTTKPGTFTVYVPGATKVFKRNNLI